MGVKVVGVDGSEVISKDFYWNRSRERGLHRLHRALVEELLHSAIPGNTISNREYKYSRLECINETTRDSY